MKLILLTQKKFPVVLFSNIKTGKITLGEAKSLQEETKKYLKKRRIGKKWKTKRKTLANIKMLCNGIKYPIKFIEYYGSLIFQKQSNWRRMT